MRLVLGAVLVAIWAGAAHAQPAAASPAGEPPPAGAPQVSPSDPAPAPSDSSVPTTSDVPGTQPAGGSPAQPPSASSSPAIAKAPGAPPAGIPPAPATPAQAPLSTSAAPLLLPPDASDTSPNPAAQFLVGGVAGTVGLFAGALAGYGVHCVLGCHSIDGSFVGLQGLLIGAAIGLPTATAAGVMYGGFDRDHAGSFGWTWLGAAAGGTAAAIATRRVDNGEVAIAIVVAGAALGGTIAFDLSRTRRRPSTAIRVVPLISGGSVQLALVGAR